jgi:glyoxylase-like metal-dependent hydrolase (beta-lactamase superfamily II)
VVADIVDTYLWPARDSVLVDTFITVEQADILVDWVVASGKNLATIYVTHGHGDHFFGIGALLDRFPNARAVATPDVVKLMRQHGASRSTDFSPRSRQLPKIRQHVFSATRAIRHFRMARTLRL